MSGLGMCVLYIRVVYCFCKQKTAYEMRISDWRSDVGSSDLATPWCSTPAMSRRLSGRPWRFRASFTRSSATAGCWWTGASSCRCRWKRCGRSRHDCRRSEEHTSELQSLMRISYAVFCLKKKKQKKHHRDVDVQQRV